MISIVLVSHSEALANGVRELVAQMAPDVPIAVGAGTDNPEEPIGTDPMRVLAAIESVDSADGVLVLMDLGSALMSAETAIEFLEPEQQERVWLCEAPLVEGALAAAVAAATGDMQRVLAEARGALDAKRTQLAPHLPPDLLARESSSTEAMQAENSDADSLHLELIVPNRLGLHARPAARLVQLVNRHDAIVTVQRGEQTVNAASLNSIATLGVRQNDVLHLRARGPDARPVLDAIAMLAADNFGDRDEADELPFVDERDVERTSARQDDATGDSLLTGVAASPGVAVGPAFFATAELPAVEPSRADDPSVEYARLEQAIQRVESDLKSVRQRTARSVSADEADIFDAHLLILRDPELLRDAQQHIDMESLTAESAWRDAVQKVASAYRAMDSAYQRERAADVIDVGTRVLRTLTGHTVTINISEPSVLLLAELTPSLAGELDPSRVLGIISERGGATSHGAILARALGIPAVTGAGAQIAAVEPGTTVALDGTEGHVWLAPTAEQAETLRARRIEWLDEKTRLQQSAQLPVQTRDGTTIEVAANIGSARDARVAREQGADGVGLFRTEILFMQRKEAPSEAEQLAAYSEAAAALKGRPLIVRTLDVGGDKPIAYFNMGSEENPFLGWRAIRYSLDRPDFFKVQLRALLRAAVDHPIHIMLPFISTLGEVEAAQALLREAGQEAQAAGHTVVESPSMGVMIEVPSAVFIADRLARAVDFFSVGTNDLTQYVLAADRTNARVANRIDPLNPALLHALERTARAAHDANIWIGMCGELAGDPLVTPLLLGLGFTELSMSAPSIGAVKAAVRAVDLTQARALAQHALTLDSADAVRAYLRSQR